MSDLASDYMFHTTARKPPHGIILSVVRLHVQLSIAFVSCNAHTAIKSF